MTGGKSSAPIYLVNYDDLPDLSPTEADQLHNISSHPDESHWKRIPLLEDVFRLVGGNVSFIVEFKMDSNLLISEVQNIISQHNQQGRIVWFSLQEGINAKLRRANPKIPTITSVPGLLKVLALHYLWLLPFVNIPDAIFGITTEKVSTYIYLSLYTLLVYHPTLHPSSLPSSIIPLTPLLLPPSLLIHRLI